MNNQIAIIGAGLAGSYLTKRMLDAGVSVTLFDKARGTGGRLASCRLDEYSTDLGAPCFEARQASAFAQWLQQQPGVERWHPSTGSALSNQRLIPELYTHRLRNSALTRQLCEGATLHCDTHVGHIVRDTHGLTLLDLQGQPLGCFSSVVVATPAQQAVRLLNAVPRFADLAAQTETLPTWVGIFLLSHPSNLQATLITPPDGLLLRAINSTAKPGRNIEPEIWQLEATADWSQKNLNTAPETVGELMINALSEHTEKPILVAKQRIHRWLFSRHLSNSTAHCLWDEESGIGVCGDWLGRGSMECAWNSAGQLANRLLTQMEK